MSDAAFALIAETFPGVEIESWDPPEGPGTLSGSRIPPGTPGGDPGAAQAVLVADPLVDELVDAVGAMVAWFAANEPGRLDRLGWIRIMDAVKAVEKGRKPRKAQVPRPTSPSRLARSDGPLSSKIAARRVAPTIGSRRAQVLSRLVQADGGWIDGDEISRPDCGGSEGKRRLRELREELGWPIEARPNPDRETSWEYRLVDV